MITVRMLGKHKTYLQKAAASLEMAAAELENRMKRMRCEDGSTMWSTPGWSVKLDSWQHSKQFGLRITTHFMVLCVCVCMCILCSCVCMFMLTCMSVCTYSCAHVQPEPKTKGPVQFCMMMIII